MNHQKFRIARFLMFVAFSLFGACIFAYTQSWNLLQKFGEGAPVGLAWVFLFLPGILFAPALKVVTERFGETRTLLGAEVAKPLLFSSFLILNPDTMASYLLLALAYGLLFVPFYPLVYKVMSNEQLDSSDSSELENTKKSLRWSGKLETVVQTSSLAAGFLGNYVFDSVHFSGLLWLASVSSIVSIFVLPKSQSAPKAEREKLAGAVVVSYRNSLRNFFQLIANSQTKKDNVLSQSFVHSIPGAVILASNIPVGFYVLKIMQSNSQTLAWIELIFASASFISGALCVKYSHWFTGYLSHIGSTLAAAFFLICLTFFGAGYTIPYLLFFAFGFFISLTKIQGRSLFLSSVPRVSINDFTFGTQAFGNMLNITLFGLFQISKDPITNYHILAGAMILYSFLFYVVTRQNGSFRQKLDEPLSGKS